MHVRTDRASRACYRTDGGQVVYGLPDSVVHARSPEDVATVLRTAQRDGVPVTCRAGGLTTEGESVSARGVLLDVKGMNRLLDCDGRTAWVEAGMTWHHVAEALRPLGLDYTSAPLNMLSTVAARSASAASTSIHRDTAAPPTRRWNWKSSRRRGRSSA